MTVLTFARLALLAASIVVPLSPASAQFQVYDGPEETTPDGVEDDAGEPLAEDDEAQNAALVVRSRGDDDQEQLSDTEESAENLDPDAVTTEAEPMGAPAPEEEAEPQPVGRSDAAAPQDPDEAPVPAAVAVPAVDPDYRFAVDITGSGLVFAGQVPDRATRLMAINMAAGLDAVADLEIADGAPDDFRSMAFAGIAALDHLEAGRVSLSDGQWVIQGEAAIDTDADAATATLVRLSEADRWEIAISAPAAAAVCRRQVDEFMVDRSILFASGSARLAPESEADLASLAEIFSLCPAVPVYVEGHTDSDGAAEANLVLSLSRAEAVVRVLKDLGMDPQRLYAVGYGESLPVAPNETAAGKAENRRIVFSFEDAADR